MREYNIYDDFSSGNIGCIHEREGASHLMYIDILSEITEIINIIEHLK